MENLYLQLKEKCFLYQNSGAITENGKSISYIDLLKKIDLVARSFKEIGFSSDNKVCLELSNSGIYIYCFYALNKLGATLTTSKDANILITNSYKRDDNNYDKVIIVGDTKEYDDNIILWDDFLELAKLYNKPIKENDSFKISYEGLNLNGEDINECISSRKFDFKSGKSLWTSVSYNNLFALLYNVHMPLLNGINIIIDNRDLNVINDIYKPNYIFQNNLDWERQELEKFNFKSLDFAYSVGVVNPYKEQILRDIFKEKFGMCFSYNGYLISLTSKTNNMIGSVGSAGDIKICHVLKHKELTLGEVGQIVLKLNGKEIMTDKVGYISNNFLYIVDDLDKEIERKKLYKTGLPSIDKPWLKYYPKESQKDKVVAKTLYQNIKDANQDNYLEVALEYFGEEIKYYEMFNQIEIVSKSLCALGVKKGDFVTFCLPNIPEFVYLFYACNKIGAIASLIEPRTSASRILDYLEDSKSRVMFMLDLCKTNIDKIIDKSSLKTVVSISPMESVKNNKIKKMYNLTHKKIKCGGKYISYKTFKTVGDSFNFIKDCNFSSNSPVSVVYTSGTTGKPKGAVLTNETYNGQNMQLKYSGIAPHVGDRFLGNIPFFTAYGSSVGMHNALSYGVKIALVPSYKPKDFPKLIQKYRPNHVIGTPRFFEIMSESKVLKNDDLSYLQNSIYGGDKMSSSKEYKVNKFMKLHNANNIKKGLGMSEYGGGFCTTVNDDVNKLGSVGIPHVGNNVKIISKDGKELSYGRNHEVGELYVSGPTQMEGYLAALEENEKFFVTDEKGVRWSKTGDLVYMDEDGVLFFDERIKNIIVRPDGHKVPTLPLKNIIDKSDYVEDSAVVGVGYIADETGKYPMVYIVLKNSLDRSIESIHKSIETLINDNIPDRDRPEWYRYVDKLPYTLAGKVDVIKLQKKGQKFQNKKVLFENNKK